MNCVYDALVPLVEEASRKFEPLCRLNEDKLSDLKADCEMIDALAKEFDGISYTVDIDNESCEISVTLSCGYLSIDGPDHAFYDLIQNTNSVNVFCLNNGEYINIKFTFPGVWDVLSMDELGMDLGDILE